MTQATSTVPTLDHVAVVSRRPQEMFDAYERMGFRLTPLSRHVGAVKPGAAPEPWGTGNRCAMFRTGYLELLGIIEPALYCGPFPALADQYEGLHIMAFASTDIAALEQRLRATGVGVQGVISLERELDIPEGRGTARFSLLRVTPDEEREGYLNLIQHHTPDYIWQPRYLDHPNGVVSLDEFLLCVDDPDEAVQRYRRILGVADERRGAVRLFSLPVGRFGVIGPDDIASEIPGIKVPTLPFVAALTVSAGSLERVIGLLGENGVEFEQRDGRVVVPAVAGCGATCIFDQAEARSR